MGTQPLEGGNGTIKISFAGLLQTVLAGLLLAGVVALFRTSSSMDLLSYRVSQLEQKVESLTRAQGTDKALQSAAVVRP
jgi:hypothetical protein